MKRVINAVVRIEYEQDDCSYYSDLPLREKDDTAIMLAVVPNFRTEIDGIRLKSVHLNNAIPYELIDWHSLEHNPDQIFI